MAKIKGKLSYVVLWRNGQVQLFHNLTRATNPLILSSKEKGEVRFQLLTVSKKVCVYAERMPEPKENIETKESPKDENCPSEI